MNSTCLSTWIPGFTHVRVSRARDLNGYRVAGGLEGDGNRAGMRPTYAKKARRPLNARTVFMTRGMDAATAIATSVGAPKKPATRGPRTPATTPTIIESMAGSDVNPAVTRLSRPPRASV